MDEAPRGVLWETQFNFLRKLNCRLTHPNKKWLKQGYFWHRELIFLGKNRRECFYFKNLKI